MVISYLEVMHQLQSNLKFHAIRKTLAQRLVVDANGHVTVLYELVYRKERVVRLERTEDKLVVVHQGDIARLTSTTVSDTFGDGKIENVARIRSGYSCTRKVIGGFGENN